VKVVQFFQIQPYVNVRRFDDRRRWHGRGRSLLHFFSGRFTTDTEVCPDFVGLLVIECTGVRFLVRNSQLGQVLYDHIALHFQFTRQFVNPNLPHA
jgi:hypothetical protein